MLTIERLQEIERDAGMATPGPWRCCQHLKSIEADQACTCGYRGVIWGPEHDIPMAICQPGHDAEPKGEEGLGPQRYPRHIEIANSQHIANCDPQTIMELVKMARLGLLVSEKFTSWNSVAVERVTIKRSEIEGERDAKQTD